MKRTCTTVLVAFFVTSLAVYSQSVEVSFSGKEIYSGKAVQLDSVRIENLMTGQIVVLHSDFVFDLGNLTGIHDGDVEVLPSSFNLSGNFANPFVDETRFRIGINSPGETTIGLYSLTGEILVLIKKPLESGESEFIIQGNGLAPGIYLLVAKHRENSQSVKILKTGPVVSGSPAIFQSGSTSASAYSFGKTKITDVFRFTGYAKDHISAVIDTSLTTKTRLEFVFTKILYKAPQLLSFETDRTKRAIKLPIYLTVKTSDSDKILELIRIDFEGDGIIDDSISIQGNTSDQDSVQFVVRYQSEGAYTPTIEIQDKRGYATAHVLDSAISIVEMILNPETKLIRKEEIASSGITYDSSWTFTLSDEVLHRMNIQIGSILVSDTGEGFIRKVIKIEEVQNQNFVQTEQGSLNEVYEEAFLSFDNKLKFDSLTSSRNEELLSKSPSGFSRVKKSFEVKWSDPSKLLQVNLAGWLSASEPRISLYKELDKGKLVRASFLFEVSLEAKLSASGSGRGEMRKDVGGPISLGTFLIPGTFIPVTSSLQFSIGVSGKLETGVEAEATITRSIFVRATFEDGVWDVVEDGDTDFEFVPPRIALGANVKFFGSARVTTKIAGLLGPYVEVSAYPILLDVEADRSPVAELYWGIEGKIGFMMKMFVLEDIDFHAKLDGVQYKYWDSGKAIGPLSSIAPLSIAPGMVVTLRGENFGNSRDDQQVFFVRYNDFNQFYASDYIEWSNTEIRVRVPEGVDAHGTVCVKDAFCSSNLIPYLLSGLPVLTTAEVSDIEVNMGSISATCGGQISYDGGFLVTSRGVCWSESEFPTTAHAKTDNGSGIGDFTSQLTGLKVNTSYLVRAYATNGVGTSYGEVKIFNTPEEPVPLALTTTAVSNITISTANTGGNIISDGGIHIVKRGVCWSTTPNPTVLDNKTTDGFGIGVYSSLLSGLTAATTYYVRAYATNATGTGYGNEVSFTTQSVSSGGEITIGTQVWMLRNLDVSTYRNGDTISQVTDPTAWNGLTTGAWCYYNNDPAMGAIYGKLYNWYAISDPRGLAPTGWHVPSDEEWKTLEKTLGMSQSEVDATDWRGTDEGGKMKEIGTAHWMSPNTGATNSSGFTALPGGFRSGGKDYSVGSNGYWWSSSESGATKAWYRELGHSRARVSRGAAKGNGFSVRCIKDD
ncbi:MAG: IPT/TIG domain-containing protein [Bacteroidia bacterium]|nr:IPT/TIG domain-containing protein [Bacteroidia bacterium]